MDHERLYDELAWYVATRYTSDDMALRIYAACHLRRRGTVEPVSDVLKAAVEAPVDVQLPTNYQGAVDIACADGRGRYEENTARASALFADMLDANPVRPAQIDVPNLSLYAVDMALGMEPRKKWNYTRVVAQGLWAADFLRSQYIRKVAGRLVYNVRRDGNTTPLLALEAAREAQDNRAPTRASISAGPGSSRSSPTQHIELELDSRDVSATGRKLHALLSRAVPGDSVGITLRHANALYPTCAAKAMLAPCVGPYACTLEYLYLPLPAMSTTDTGALQAFLGKFPTSVRRLGIQVLSSLGHWDEPTRWIGRLDPPPELLVVECFDASSSAYGYPLGQILRNQFARIPDVRMCVCETVDVGNSNAHIPQVTLGVRCNVKGKLSNLERALWILTNSEWHGMLHVDTYLRPGNGVTKTRIDVLCEALRRASACGIQTTLWYGTVDTPEWIPRESDFVIPGPQSVPLNAFVMGQKRGGLGMGEARLCSTLAYCQMAGGAHFNVVARRTREAEVLRSGMGILAELWEKALASHQACNDDDDMWFDSPLGHWRPPFTVESGTNHAVLATQAQRYIDAARTIAMALPPRATHDYSVIVRSTPRLANATLCRLRDAGYGAAGSAVAAVLSAHTRGLTDGFAALPAERALAAHTRWYRDITRAMPDERSRDILAWHYSLVCDRDGGPSFRIYENFLRSLYGDEALARPAALLVELRESSRQVAIPAAVPGTSGRRWRVACEDGIIPVSDSAVRASRVLSDLIDEGMDPTAEIPVPLMIADFRAAVGDTIMNEHTPAVLIARGLIAANYLNTPMTQPLWQRLRRVCAGDPKHTPLSAVLHALAETAEAPNRDARARMNGHGGGAGTGNNRLTR